MPSSHLVDDVELTPYWWADIDQAPLPAAALPRRADAVVVGAGYTGLSAALTLARAGRETVVLDAGPAHGGASTRNGGQAAGQVKPSLGALIERLGRNRAVAIYAEARETLNHLERVVREERIDCGFARVGRLQPAFTARDFQGQGQEADLLRRHLGIDAALLARGELHRELGSPYYQGAMLRPDMGAVQPALLHQGLLQRARDAGAGIAEHTAATAIERDGERFRVRTPRGAISARNVIVTTNGYTGRVTGWLRRRVIPIPSQIIATEPVPPSLMAELLPRRRVVVDTCRLHHYYRASPDGRRILIGGRAVDDDRRRLGQHLYRDLLRIFPALHSTRVSHVWSGITGYSFDYLPHLGRHDGVHYALGFCGGGVTWGPYLGSKIALQVLERPEARTVFAEQSLTTRPLYTGRPWFLPVMLGYYQLRDRLAARNAESAA